MMTFWRRFVALSLFCACMALTLDRVCAEEKEASASSEIAAKCTEFLKKVIAAKRTQLDKRMADEIAEVAKVTGLGPEGVRSLEAAAIMAEDAAQADLLTNALEMYLKAYTKMGARGLKQLEQLNQPGVVDSMVKSDSGFDSAVHYTRALDQPAWKDALTHALTPEQAATWKKAQDKKIGTVSKEFEDMLDRQADQIRTTISSPMFTKSTEIIDTLNLPKERSDAVTALAKKAIDASMESWRKDARKMYLSNDEGTRVRLARGMPYYSPPQDDQAPENQAVWKDGIAKMLSADDRAKLESSRGTQRLRRTHALSMLMVTLMDDKVAFTTTQRPKLEPITERFVQKVEELYPKADSNNDYFNLNVSVFYRAAAPAKADEMRAILDDVQWKHWQAATHDKGAPNDEEEEEVQPLSTPAKPSANAIEEPEDLGAVRFRLPCGQGRRAAQGTRLAHAPASRGRRTRRRVAAGHHRAATHGRPRRCGDGIGKLVFFARTKHSQPGARSPPRKPCSSVSATRTGIISVSHCQRSMPSGSRP